MRYKCYIVKVYKYLKKLANITLQMLHIYFSISTLAAFKINGGAKQKLNFLWTLIKNMVY